MNRFSPLVGTRDCYVIHGHDADAFVTISRAEAEHHCEGLNDQGLRFVVVKLSPDGHWMDLTEDFWRAPDEVEDEYQEPRPGFHTRRMRRMGAFS